MGTEERAKEILVYCLKTVKSSALLKDPNTTTEYFFNER